MEIKQANQMENSAQIIDDSISLEIVIQSHLSDAVIEMTVNPKLAMERIKFVKRLIAVIGLDGQVSESLLDEIWEKANG